MSVQDNRLMPGYPLPPVPPPARVVTESGGAICDLCGSSMMRRRFYLFGPRPGCLHVRCRNYGGDRDLDRMIEVRKKAAWMWVKDGGHMPYQNGGLIHEFMVQHPDTRKKYERFAEKEIDATALPLWP